LDYVLEVYQNSFFGFLDDIHWNNRGHPISERHPTTEFFHHHALLDEDTDKRVAEQAKLIRRVARFMDIARKPVVYIYCYQMDERSASDSALQHFSGSVDRALAIWPNAQLHVYFMFDCSLCVPFNLIPPRDRLYIHTYLRDASVDKTWGSMPGFISELTAVC
jgi:hypothetical protein